MFGREPVLPLYTLLGPKVRYLGKGDPENNHLPTKLQPGDTVLIENHTKGPFDPSILKITKW